MPIPIPDFEGEFVKAIRRNLKDALRQLNTNEENMVEKINTFVDCFGFPAERVKQKIRRDIMFRAKFAINPGRQNLHENLAADFIRQLPNVENFENLPKSGFQILSGAVLPRKDVIKMGASKMAKTIDFQWDSFNIRFYASHKYTKTGGGGQDNQYEDLQDFIEEANKSHLPNTIFLAIADGGYYDMRDTTSGTTKLQYLRNLANRRNVFAISSSELEIFIQKIKK